MAFSVTDKNNKFYFTRSFTDDCFIQIIMPKGTYEIESLNNQIKRIIFEESHYTESNHPYTIKLNF